MADINPEHPDALMMPESLKRGGRSIDRINSVLDVAEPILGIDRAAGQRAYIRRQPGHRLFVTADPADTLKVPSDRPGAGLPCYRWEARGDLEYGWRIDR